LVDQGSSLAKFTNIIHGPIFIARQNAQLDIVGSHARLIRIVMAVLWAKQVCRPPFSQMVTDLHDI